MSKTSSKEERELTAIELARAAGIRLDGLYVTLRSGKIPARKDSSGEWKISAKAFERYMLRDVAFKAVGVGSVGTFCAIGLFTSHDGAPLFLQIKEAGNC